MPVVVGQRVGDQHVAAGRLAARERRLAAHAEVRRERRPVVRVERGERKVERLRIEPLDGDVEVALQRALRRIVERQLDDRARRGRGSGGPRLIGVGGARGGELLRGGARDLVEARGRSAVSLRERQRSWRAPRSAINGGDGAEQRFCMVIAECNAMDVAVTCGALAVLAAARGVLARRPGAAR